MHNYMDINDMARHYIENPRLIPKAWKALEETCLSHTVAAKIRQALELAAQGMGKEPNAPTDDKLDNELREAVRRHSIVSYVTQHLSNIVDWPVEAQVWKVKQKVEAARCTKPGPETLAWREVARQIKIYKDCNLTVLTPTNELTPVTKEMLHNSILKRDDLRKKVRALERKIKRGHYEQDS